MSLDFTKAEVDILFTYQKPTERTAALYAHVTSTGEDCLQRLAEVLVDFSARLGRDDPPSQGQLQPYYDSINVICKNFFKQILDTTPSCEFRDRALANIMLARMRANASLTNRGLTAYGSYLTDAKLLANAAIAMYDSEDGALTNHRREQQQLNIPFHDDDIPF